jgi:hypothetical protein
MEQPAGRTITNILGDYTEFGQQIVGLLQQNNISLSEIEQVDHFCYRVETLAWFEELHRQLGEIATEIYCNEVAGRIIPIFRLHTPIELIKGMPTELFELPAPKLDTPYSEGYEHVECVVDLDGLINRYPDTRFEIKTHPWPEAVVQNEGVTIKFHERPLDEIAAEQEKEQHEH